MYRDTELVASVHMEMYTGYARISMKLIYTARGWLQFRFIVSRVVCEVCEDPEFSLNACDFLQIIPDTLNHTIIGLKNLLNCISNLRNDLCG